MTGRSFAWLCIMVLPVSCSSQPAPTACPDGAASVTALDEASIDVTLRPVSDTQAPTAAVPSPASTSLWVTQRPGVLVEVDLDTGAGRVLLDLSDEVDTDGEGGLVGVAVSPGGDRLILGYTGPAGVTNLVGYRIVDGAPVADSRVVHLEVDQPSTLHTGGSVAFGPDGYLYVAMGDGAEPDDVDSQTAAQDPSSLRGKMLRLDPVADGGYTIPPSNPMGGDRTEVWASGVRNPWGFHLDPQAGDLWVADVGESCREEVNLVGAGTPGNLGWPMMEGTHHRTGQPPADAIAPLFEYRHELPASAVIGGVVYRGAELPELEGAFLLADYGQGVLAALVPHRDGGYEPVRFEAEIPRPVGFATTHTGEVLVLSEAAGIFLIASP